MSKCGDAPRCLGFFNGSKKTAARQCVCVLLCLSGLSEFVAQTEAYVGLEVVIVADV